MADLREKALQYLQEARVQLREVLAAEGLTRVTFHVLGSDPSPYYVKGILGPTIEWTCDCPARTQCSHILAATLVMSAAFEVKTVTEAPRDLDIDKILGI